METRTPTAETSPPRHRLKKAEKPLSFRDRLKLASVFTPADKPFESSLSLSTEPSLNESAFDMDFHIDFKLSQQPPVSLPLEPPRPLEPSVPWNLAQTDLQKERSVESEVKEEDSETLKAKESPQVSQTLCFTKVQFDKSNFNGFLSKFKPGSAGISETLTRNAILQRNSNEEMLLVDTSLHSLSSGGQRSQLRAWLINQQQARKTACMKESLVYERTTTELMGKKAKEDSDSEFDPEEKDETEEALALQKMIDLEEGGDKVDMDLEQPQQDLEEPEALADEEESEQEEESEAELSSTESDISQHSVAQADEAAKDAPLSPVRLRARRVKNPLIDDEAQLGSDAEEHDDVVRHTNDYDEDDESDSGEIEGLIDHTRVDTNEDALADRHFASMISKDQEELQQVINGQFKRKRGTDYIDDSSDFVNKKLKLIHERAQGIGQRFDGLVTGETAFSKSVDYKGDDEDYEHLRLTREISELRAFRQLTQRSQIIDENTLYYLNLVEKPDIVLTNKSLILDRSNSGLKVFQEANTSSRSYVFSREETQGPTAMKPLLPRQKSRLLNMLSQ